MTLEAELLWTGERFERHPHVRDRRALLPGFVSAHSHAFQRALRGRGETFPAGSGSFWSWREAMYELVGQLDEERFLTEVRATFAEMRAAGITTVGEFHYLPELNHLVLQAAKEAGIRITLLLTYYKTGGIGQPLAP
ncbi:MAG TPA: amidohydrolase family protein, partial [Thermoanaerobaculia bacterium]